MLDNFEHLLDGAALLSEVLAYAPEIRLIVTSRERLNLVEEWVLDVDGLAYPSDEHETNLEHYSAVELFMQHARRVKASFRLNEVQRPAIARICRLVDGMPLGIELAASWVRALSCEAIAEEIAHSLDILETPRRNVEPRHRTMRAAFVPTWARLSEEERDVFMRLSVFRGGFTREAAEQVAGATLRSLSALVDKSLLRVDGNGRYDLHELLRHFGDEQLNASPDAREQTRDAHSTYYAHFLQQKWQPIRTREQVVTVKKIEVEFENIRTAWQTMTDRRNSTELSVAVYSLWFFCNLRGRAFDAVALFRQATDALHFTRGSEAVERLSGVMLVFNGWFANYLGALGEARTLANEGLMILQQVGSPEDILLALYCLSSVEVWDGNLPAVRTYGEQMVQIAEDIKDPWFLACALMSVAYGVSYSSNDLEEATHLAQAFFKAAESCGDTGMRAISLFPVRAYIAMRRGDFIESRSCCEQALELWEALGTSYMIGATYQQLGLIAVRTSNYLLAASHFQKGLKLHAEAGRTRFVYDSLLGIAQLWKALGSKERAVELFTLVLPQPFILPELRVTSEQCLNQLRVELSPGTFAAAQENGRQLEIGTVVEELTASLDAQVITELSQLVQKTVTAVPATDRVTLASPLTLREMEILRLVADGLTNSEIAERLFIGVSTVKKHITHIFDKFDTKNRTQAVAYARERQILP